MQMCCLQPLTLLFSVIAAMYTTPRHAMARVLLVLLATPPFVTPVLLFAAALFLTEPRVGLVLLPPDLTAVLTSFCFLATVLSAEVRLVPAALVAALLPDFLPFVPGSAFRDLPLGFPATVFAFRVLAAFWPAAFREEAGLAAAEINKHSQNLNCAPLGDLEVCPQDKARCMTRTDWYHQMWSPTLLSFPPCLRRVDRGSRMVDSSNAAYCTVVWKQHQHTWPQLSMTG